MRTLTPPRPAAVATRRWSAAHGLALIGIPFLAWEAWTVTAWLADGPHPVTTFRTTGSSSWWAARVIEGLLVVVAVAVTVHLVRDCRRTGRLLTFDVMFCLAALGTVNGDVPNLLHPVLLYSSNWINLNAMCGHMPFVVNPDCGRAPDPIFAFGLMTLFAYLGMAIVAGRVVSRARSRRPGISNGRLLVGVLAGGIVLDLLIEAVLVIPLRLWSWTPMPGSLSLGGGFHYPWIEALAAGLFLGLVMAVRVFRDDRGRTIVQRGLEHHTPSRRTAVTMLALYGAFQLGVWGVANLPVMTLGFYQRQWSPLPSHVVNDLCDAPGVHGTRYGPCPGSPGYRMPGRHSLPGRSP